MLQERISSAPQYVCIHDLLQARAQRTPEAPAIVAPGRLPLTYGRLYWQIEMVVQSLRALGVERQDRVVLVLPQGAEMAVAFLAVASSATCVPLNPAYSAPEFERYLAHLRPKALIVPAGMDSPARPVAHTQGLRVIELLPMPELEAGLFTLAGGEPRYAAPYTYTQPADAALVLFTSGTTSRPKMVSLTQASICTSAHYNAVVLALSAQDRCLDVMPLFHVHGLVSMLLVSLMAGSSVVCPAGFDAPTFFTCMAEFRPTWYSAVPTIHQAILAHAGLHQNSLADGVLRFIRSSSAPLPPQVLVELERVFKVPVIETYGLTEAILITANPLPPGRRKIGSVGRAAGPEVAVMNQAGQVLPVGATGEIVVRGANVIQHYDDDPATTQSAFTHGWFRTGDQGFLDADGYLFITGRLKEMINRGGEPVAPREVEEVLMTHPGVAEAVAFAVPHPRLGEEVGAAVVLRQGVTTTDRDIRAFAAARLAHFKVPRQVHIVETIPKGPTGKLQRLDLAAQFGLGTTAPVPDTLPAKRPLSQTPLEEVLAGLWSQVLGIEQVGRHDDFFQLGGDSILATQLIARIREATHIDVSFRSFFDTPTVGEMAQNIEQISRDTPGWSIPALPHLGQAASLPLAAAQQRLWFLEQLGLSRDAYTILEVIRFRGPLHIATLTQSLQEIIRRHEILRTTFVNIEGQPRQVVGPATSLPLPCVDLQAVPESKRQGQILMLARAAAQQPFDLEGGPLLRTQLVRLAPEAHVLLLTMHHIISDGWSHGVFWRELATLYAAYSAGKPSPLPELPIQYTDFASWQQQWLQGEGPRPHLTYWQQQLAGIVPLQLPTDRPRPAVQTFRGARHRLVFSPALTRALKALSQRCGVTLFMTLLAAFQTLLYRYTGQDDIVVGSLMANRHRVETEALIGFFVNIVPLRTDLSHDPSFRELLGRVREVTFAAYNHQDLPYEKLLETLPHTRNLSRNPLFQVLFAFQNVPRQPAALPGLTLEVLEVDREIAELDLLLQLAETSERLCGWFEYSTDLFDTATIARMAGHLRTLLEGIVATPEQRLSRLPVLTADECQHLVEAWNQPRRDFLSDHCLHQVFEAQVARTPDVVAVSCADTRLTYRELNRRANQVAHYLQGLGVGPEGLVGLCMERSLDMVVGLLGILKAGGVYVPLDPSYPPERLTFMVEDSCVPVLLTQKCLQPRLVAPGVDVICLDTEWPQIASQSDQNPRSRVTADNAAYVLYTSGSTGQPRGVVGVHRATLNTLAWIWQTLPFTEQDVSCQKTSISFGDSIQELFGSLLRGIRTVLVPDVVVQDLPQFVHTLAAHRVTRLILVPSLLRVLLDTYGDLQRRLPSLQLWIVSGESLSKALWQHFRERLPESRLLNLYGTSEVSDDTTWYDTSQMEPELLSVPIGRPIANMQVYVLDQHLQPVPPGAPGELYVSGTSVTRGYLNHAALTATQYVPHLFSKAPGERLYKTGDLVRYLPDGNLEYLGRLDQQVKLNGVRVELGEIEAALAGHPAVQDAVVSAHEDGAGGRRLVAYVVLAQEPGPTLRELRRFLAQKLPDYMVPSTFIRLETWPLTPSGKVDRRALPRPDHTRPDLVEPFVAPRTPVEQQIAIIWSHLLGLEQVGIHDNFFELGGHSLLAMQLVYRVHEATGRKISLANFFATPTVAGMAGSIATTAQITLDSPTSPLLPVPRQGRLPASIAQEQLWGLTQLLPGLPFFHMPYALRLAGVLSVPVLEQSLNEIVRRHEALRTTFAPVDGQLGQIIAPPLSLALEVVDLCALPAREREGAARRLVRAEVQRPFDLTHGPLLRSCLLRLDVQEHLLLLTMHHIISDGWSLGVLTHELAVLYDAGTAGDLSPLPALPLQYADFAYWQQQWRHNAELETQLAYWQHQLRVPYPTLELPTDRPRTPDALSFLYSARQAVVLPKGLAEALKRWSYREGSTLFMTLLAAFNILLYSYTRQEDLCVGSLIANRHRRETEGLIGLFVNTVILRTDLSGNPTCREVLQRVRATTLAAYAHQDLPFEVLVRSFEHESHRQRVSLCQVMLILQDAMRQPPQPSASSLRFLHTDPGLVELETMPTTFDIVLMLREGPQGLSGSCLYKPHLFDAATIQRLLDDFQQVLERMSAVPEQPLSGFHALGELYDRRP